MATPPSASKPPTPRCGITRTKTTIIAPADSHCPNARNSVTPNDMESALRVDALVPVTVAAASTNATSRAIEVSVARWATVTAISAATAPLTTEANSRETGKFEGKLLNRTTSRPRSPTISPETRSGMQSGPRSKKSTAAQKTKMGALRTHTAPTVTPTADSIFPLDNRCTKDPDPDSILEVRR